LAGHQVGDGGFEVGFADVGFREGRAKFPVIVDDDIKSLVVYYRLSARRVLELRGSFCRRQLVTAVSQLLNSGRQKSKARPTRAVARSNWASDTIPRQG
jgi:hypothetical protein